MFILRQNTRLVATTLLCKCCGGSEYTGQMRTERVIEGKKVERRKTPHQRRRIKQNGANAFKAHSDKSELGQFSTHYDNDKDTLTRIRA